MVNSTIDNIEGHHLVAGQHVEGGVVNNNFFGERRENASAITSKAWIPFEHNPDFVTREAVCNAIDEEYAKAKCIRRLALVGLGGVGKTELAVVMANRIEQMEENAWIFWIRAGTRALFEQDFGGIAQTAGIPGYSLHGTDIMQVVHDWLRSTKSGRWFIILDGADDPSVFDGNTGNSPTRKPFDQYLPKARAGSMIIITSRNKALGFKLADGEQNVIKVGPMTEIESCLLLRRRLQLSSDAAAATALVNALEYIPQAICQANAYMRAQAPRLTLQEYHDELSYSETKKAQLLLKTKEGEIRQYTGSSHSILHTWRASFECIRSTSQSAADLLSLMGFFHSNGIPEELIRPESQRNLDLQQTHELRQRFDEDVAILLDFFFITARGGNNTFEMQELVQLSTRMWVRDSELENKFKQQFIERLAAAFPIPNYRNWRTCQHFWAHVQVAIRYSPSYDMPEDWAIHWATLLHNGGCYARLQGHYDIAAKMIDSACKARQISLGENDRATLASKSSRSLVYLDQGQTKQAHELCEEVLNSRTAEFGVDDPDTLTSMALLAFIYRAQGWWDKAEGLGEKTVKARIQRLGQNHVHTLMSRADLASTWRSRGRWVEAEEEELKVIAIYKGMLPADHQMILTVKANLASTYRCQSHWKKAEALDQEILSICNANHEADHPITLAVKANLASTYKGQGLFEKAEEFEVYVVKASEKLFGRDHPDTVTSMANLSSTYRKMDRLNEAEKLSEQVMEIRKRCLRANHPDGLISMANLALIYNDQGRPDKADALWKKAIALSNDELGNDHPDTLIIKDNLLLILGRHNLLTDAMNLAEDLAKRSADAHGETHPDTLTRQANLACIYEKQGRLSGAAELRLHVWKARKESHGETDPLTMASMVDYASICKCKGDDHVALQLIKDCHKGRLQSLGPEHADTISSKATMDKWENEENKSGFRTIMQRFTNLGFG